MKKTFCKNYCFLYGFYCYIILNFSSVIFAADFQQPKFIAPIIGMTTGIIPKHHFKIRINYKYLIKDELISGSNKIINTSNKKSKGKVILTRIYYGLKKNCHIVLAIPYYQKESINSGIVKNSNGLGDIRIGFKSKILNQNKKNFFSIALLVALKLATGKDNNSYNDKILPVKLQPGTGSTDFLFGIFSSKYFYILKHKPIFCHLELKYKINNDGSQNYKFGNKLIYNVSLTHSFYKSFFLSYELNGSYSKEDKKNNIKQPNTGGSELYFSPGVKYNCNKKLSIESSIQIKVYHNLNGIQNTSNINYYSGIQYKF